MNWNWLYRAWVNIKFAYNTFLMQITKGKISYNEVHKVIKKNVIVNNNAIFISDNNFTLTSSTIMEKLIKASPLKYREYQKEIYDCDDFSFSFMGLMRLVIPNFAIGVCWTATHALNFYIDDHHVVWLIEPQNNTTRLPTKSDKFRLMII